METKKNIEVFKISVLWDYVSKYYVEVKECLNYIDVAIDRDRDPGKESREQV